MRTGADQRPLRQHLQFSDANNFKIACDAVPSTYLCRALVTTSTSFKGTSPPNDPPDFWNTIMPAVKQRACTILGEFERAQTELVGKAVILTDGKAGTVESVWLDEIHGLRISIRGHEGNWPVSTIKFAQTA
jgi:hypothetical protein